MVQAPHPLNGGRLCELESFLVERKIKHTTTIPLQLLHGELVRFVAKEGQDCCRNAVAAEGEWRGPKQLTELALPQRSQF